MYHSIDPQTRSPKPRCCQAPLLLWALGEDPACFVLLQAALGAPWLMAT